MRRWVVAGGSLIAPFLATAALSTPLTFRPAQPINSSCQVRALRFQLTDGTERERRLEPPLAVLAAGVTQDVPVPESTATISAVAEGCWLATTAFHPNKPAVISAWPLATLVVGHDAVEPAKAAARIRIVDSKADDQAIVEGATCTCTEGAARCSVPALRVVHARVELAGYAPVYVKNISATENSIIQVGPFKLSSAYTLEGTVTEGRRRPVRNARVHLAPVTAGEMTASERLLHTLVDTSDRTGAFRFKDVEPGLYRVRSRSAGYSDAVIDSLEVVDHNVRLQPLIHLPRATLDVVITPPVAPDNALWRIELKATGRRQSEVVTAAAGSANAAGVWSSDPLQAGVYTLAVSAASRSVAARREITLTGGKQSVAISISSIAIRGRLLSGDAGIPGELTFSLASGLIARATVDDEGSFSVTFPLPGSWAPRFARRGSSTLLRLPSLEIREDTTSLDLKLGDRVINGLLRDQEGGPADGVVTVQRNGRLIAQTASTAGKFVFDNLEEADYSVEAEGEKGFARPVAVDLRDDESADVELTLAPERFINGLVLSAAGRPLSGAIVRMFDPVSTRYEETIADAEGLFSIPVRTLGPIDLIVLAPPAPVIVRRLTPAQWHGQTITLTVPGGGAVLRVAMARVPPFPSLRGADGAERSLELFLMPRIGTPIMREFIDGAFQFTIEPGSYVICYRSDCRSVVLPPGSEATFDYFSAESRP